MTTQKLYFDSSGNLRESMKFRELFYLPLIGLVLNTFMQLFVWYLFSGFKTVFDDIFLDLSGAGMAALIVQFLVTLITRGWSDEYMYGAHLDRALKKKTVLILFWCIVPIVMLVRQFYYKSTVPWLIKRGLIEKVQMP